MYEYTTPTITVKLTGVEFDQVDYVRVAIKGRGSQIVREVSVSSFDTEEGTASITLTQEETAAFGVGQITIQARIHYISGAVQATNKVTKQLGDVIDEVVI